MPANTIQRVKTTKTKPMERYPSYKPTGVKWLGEIPSHWEMLPGLAVFKENKEKNNDLSINTVLSLSYGKIVVKKDIDEGLVPAEYNTYQIVRPGYIIIRCTDLQNDKVSLRTGLVKDEGIITGAYLGLVTSKKYDSSYIHYFLHAWDITKEIYRHGNGLRQSLSWLDLRRLPILIPPLEEQSAIAAYLDTATAKIGAAIAQQQKMIALLNERKQIIINRAVTKGLNPNAKMKDSGVEWIGEVPEHWECRRIRFIGEADNGLTYSPLDMVDEGNGVLVLRSSNIKDGKLVYEDNVFVKQVPKKLIVQKNDIIICSRNGSASLVGKCAIIEDEIQASFGAFMMRFRSPHNSKYIYYLLTSAISHYKQLFATSTINQLTLGIFSDIKMSIVLDVEEQKAIAQKLDLICGKINASIEKCNSQISLLQERKQIIINEVVTGKVKVSK